MIGNLSQLEGKPISNPAAKNASMKVLVSPAEGWMDGSCHAGHRGGEGRVYPIPLYTSNINTLFNQGVF